MEEYIGYAIVGLAPLVITIPLCVIYLGPLIERTERDAPLADGSPIGAALTMCGLILSALTYQAEFLVGHAFAAGLFFLFYEKKNVPAECNRRF